MRRLPSARLLGGLLAAAALGFAAPANGQSDALVAPCARGDVPAEAREYCVAVAQAVTSAQPQLGILLAGGNPTLGSASTAGLRLGLAPGTGFTARANLVQIRIPDVLDGSSSGGALAGQRTIVAPSVSGTVSVSVFPGTDLAPTVGGIGALDLLGSVHWLPLRALDVSSFRLESSEFSYGVGARLGVVRESFTVPGASVSVMYRRFSDVGFGSVCSAPLALPPGSAEGYRFASGACPGAGDPGEFVLDLTSVSGRGVVGKQLGQLGLAAGVGFDRFDSDLAIGFRAPEGSLAGAAGYVARASDLDVVSDRWSTFANATFSTVVTTFSFEGGWMQGGEAVPGFAEGGDFDPGRGTLFASIGVRLAL